MPNMASTIRLAPGQENVSDAARARELYKYYQPSNAIDIPQEIKAIPTALSDGPSSLENIDLSSNASVAKVSSPDTALTAFAQLVSWRTGCQRAMISVIDRHTQYFIAESTRTIDLVDNTKHGQDDALWMGCSDVSKDGRLCERTIAVPPSTNGEYRAFIVSDLTRDPQFNQLPFVNGPPFIKFYAGTPLITKLGIPIGSLFVVDDRVMEDFSAENIHFMGTMAETIMRHMELTREVEEHRRGMKMSRGLASFVEGRSQLVEAEADVEDEGATIAGEIQVEAPSVPSKSRSSSKRNSRAISKRGSVSSIGRKEREYSQALTAQEENILASGPQLLSPPSYDVSGEESKPESPASRSLPGSFDTYTNTNSIPESTPILEKPAVSPNTPELSEASSLKHLFSRATNLIREAFEVDGGSVFYDAQKGISGEFGKDMPEEAHAAETQSSSGDDGVGADIPQSPRSASAKFGHGNVFSRSSIHSTKKVEILGFSTPLAASIHGEEPPGPRSFSQLDERSLHALLRRYPRGKLWIFDEDGPVSSSSEDETRKVSQPALERHPTQAQAQRQRRKARMVAEARALQRHFPGVRNLLFVPLWDSARSRWLAGNFTWTTETTRILSKQSELSFLTGFCNSVMAECSRLDTEMADQKKSDFIGSISHELRSPLHGILASAEFLGEEVTDGFAKGLVETIDSCGRTLLDTINHILDFSKINHFEKNWRRSKRLGNGNAAGRFNAGGQMTRTSGAVALRQADLPMINLFAEVDVSVVCEEVVESVFAGHVFQNVTAPSFDMVADSRGRMSDKKFVTSGVNLLAESSHPTSDVSVIFDVDMKNYHFTTQPGAFRRVIMNLLGNALKYTSHGYVRVKLEATELDDYQPPGTLESIPRSCLSLTVSDTGKGISSEFIRSKLFTPFAQENSLSSGTGLGLSIVRSIVALLEGEIQIKSELGHGTEVTVTLPLLREMPKDLSSGSTSISTASSNSKQTDEIISQLRTRVIGKTATLLGFDKSSKDPILDQSNQYLATSLTNFLTQWYGMVIVPTGQKADIIVVNEPNASTVESLAVVPSNTRRPPIVLTLCSHSTRFDRSNSIPGSHKNVGYLIKPIGPLKLAKAIAQCLDGVPPSQTPGVPPPASIAGALAPENIDLSNVFEELSLSPNMSAVLDNNRMAASSANARKALESPTPMAGNEKHSEFPFPVDERPKLDKQWSFPEDKISLSTAPHPPPVSVSKPASLVLTGMEKTAAESSATKHDVGSSQPPTTEQSSSSPRLLLVDDNRINLRLLKTYMRKRQYEDIDEAENGLEAVNAFEKQSDGYDIVFMDISMPVLDGFGATRQIRQLENRRREKKASEGAKPVTPALVIALTGLASSRDQNEAFTSGVDLFLTKPVSFKEVGKLLDNWQANAAKDGQ